MQPTTTPETPQKSKQIMDVAAPMRTEQQPLAVHQAPADTSKPQDAPKDTKPSADETPKPAATVAAHNPHEASKPKGPKKPVAAIFMAILAMIGLSVLTVLVYLKS